eukprot:scaffold52910_cov62-Attheya_sp.AAC.1
MLLTIPRINDYRGGAALLGLGDIVLPGLLISFAARLDAAKALVQTCNLAVINARGNNPTTDATALDTTTIHSWYKGYFYPLVLAYFVGLLGANLGVYFMNQGQPALLYLVPACLGTMLILGSSWYHNELADLWKGPPAIQTADRVLQAMRFNNSRRTLTTATPGPPSPASPASPATPAETEMIPIQQEIS